MGVRVNDAELLEQIVGRPPYGMRRSGGELVDHLYSVRRANPSPRRGVRNFHTAYSDILQILRTESIEDLVSFVSEDLRRYVAEFARTRVFVHAGVVALGGRAIVVPGASMSGKSSLVAEMVRAGAVYYSDEYAVLDDDGLVHPFIKPIALRSPDHGERAQVLPQELGGRAGRKAVPIGAVVATQFREGVRWRPRRLSPAKGLFELLAHTVPAQRRPQAVLPVLHKAVNGATVLKGRRGEASQVATRLVEMFS